MDETQEVQFEQAFSELEEVVQQLERGDLSLQQSLALFKRGIALAKLCEMRLDQAEQVVLQLTTTDSQTPVLSPFEGAQ
jgi:exodeoxyribonuclease VII small subunit